jgi:hypothetical protein
MDRYHDLLDEFQKLEDSFYNIDTGLIQHPELIAFAKSLEYFKQFIISSTQENIPSITNYFIDKLQLQALSNTKYS